MMDFYIVGNVRIVGCGKTVNGYHVATYIDDGISSQGIADVNADNALLDTGLLHSFFGF